MQTNHHAVRYQELLLRDGTDPKDVERQALFFIFSGMEDLYNKVNGLYDFEDNSIRPEALEGGVDLTSGTRALVELAFNLYNGFPSRTIRDLMAPLSEDNRRLAVDAITLRFGMLDE